jgi:hypothetical protein
MPAARNEPCPCGSGKKYKACCLRTDQARERTIALLGTGGEVAWHAEARRAAVWEAEVVPLPVAFSDDPDAAPALVMVVAAGFVVAGDTLGRRPIGAAERARVVADAVRKGGRVLGVLPARIHVRDRALAEALERELAGRDLVVEAAPLPELEPALDAALEHLCRTPGAGRVTSPAVWAETEAAEEQLADYHAAAAEFFAAAPWTRLRDDELLRIDMADGSSWTASVMGGAGVEYGLALYAERDDLLALMDEDVRPGEALLGMVGCAVTTSFETRTALSRAMQREVASRGWPIAAPAAYPRVLGLNLPERRLTAAHLRTAAAALRTVARLTRGEEPDASEVTAVFPLDPEGAPPPWPLPEVLEPVCAEGEGADPAAALRAYDDDTGFEVAEEARLERMLAWLEADAPSKAARSAALRNARLWTDFLQYNGLPAGAVAEYDLRLFLYDFYPHRANAPKTAARALPRSLRRIAAFLEEEGIRYPFAERVLAELEAIAAGEPLERVLADLEGAVFPDLDARGMVHDSDLPGSPFGWPPFMNAEVALLEHELQRRWLLWYDEAVRNGVDDFVDLRAVLVRRQREWESAPHDGFGGRTPAEVVRAYRPPGWG